VDFGSATYLGKIFDKSLKNFRDINENEKIDNYVGTAEYISPEALNNENIGLETDLWSLGTFIIV